jgi:carbon-monoxide dehydrogenase catalytic subunit
MGECIDNARASAFFKAVAAAAGVDIKDMPFAFLSPEWSNEKGIGAALSFRLQGIHSYHCVHLPVQGSDNVMAYACNGTEERFGSRMVVDPDHVALMDKLMRDMDARRKVLSFNQ